MSDVKHLASPFDRASCLLRQQLTSFAPLRSGTKPLNSIINFFWLSADGEFLVALVVCMMLYTSPYSMLWSVGIYVGSSVKHFHSYLRLSFFEHYILFSHSFFTSSWSSLSSWPLRPSLWVRWHTQPSSTLAARSASAPTRLPRPSLPAT